MSDSVRSVSVDQLLRILIGYWMVSFISLAREPECPQLPWPDHNEPALLQTLIEPVGGQEVDHTLSKQLADPQSMRARLHLDDPSDQQGLLEGAAVETGLVDIHVVPEPVDDSILQGSEDGVGYPDKG